MTTDLNTEGEVLTARFAEKKAATLAASELFDLGFSSTDFHIAFEQGALPEGLEMQDLKPGGWQSLLERMHVLPHRSGRQEIAVDATGASARLEAPGVTLILTVHASAQVRAILNQHGAVLT